MKSAASKKLTQRIRRHARIRAKVVGLNDRPRLSIYKSNKYIWAQVIDDAKHVTLASVTTKGIKGKNETERATLAGKKIAEEVIAKGVKKVVFDRGGFIYTGRVRAIAEGAREGGLSF
ncbi:MAG: 50S ribosomal protein L18 [Minisyncoccia bacterium]